MSRDWRIAMRKPLVLGACVLAASALIRADGVPTTVTYVPHDKAASTFVKGGQILGDKGLVVLANRREAGEVEVHEKTNHIFIILEGEATVITVGNLVDSSLLAPGQPRAKNGTGGS